MRKTLFLLTLIVYVSIPLAFAHPNINSALINDIAGPIPGVKIIGLEQESNQEEIEIEFLSDQWIVENFIWMLFGGIAIIMGITVLAVFNEELSSAKILKMN